MAASAWLRTVQRGRSPCSRAALLFTGAWIMLNKQAFASTQAALRLGGRGGGEGAAHNMESDASKAPCDAGLQISGQSRNQVRLHVSFQFTSVNQRRVLVGAGGGFWAFISKELRDHSSVI